MYLSIGRTILRDRFVRYLTIPQGRRLEKFHAQKTSDERNLRQVILTNLRSRLRCGAKTKTPTGGVRQGRWERMDGSRLEGALGVAPRTRDTMFPVLQIRRKPNESANHNFMVQTVDCRRKHKSGGNASRAGRLVKRVVPPPTRHVPTTAPVAPRAGAVSLVTHAVRY